jgi:LEA14-like dessication related protein
MRLTPVFRPFFMVALVLSALSVGCTTTTYEKSGIAIELLGVTVKTGTAGESVAVCRVRVKNLAVYPIGIETVRCRLGLAGAPIGETAIERVFALPQEGESVQDISIPAVNAAGGARLRAMAGGPPVDYHLEIRLETTVGEERLILTSAGDGQVTVR